MNMFEEARAMAGMLKLCGMTQEALAEKMGVSQSYVANKLRLLGFDQKSEEMIVKGSLSERHARAILRLTGDEARQRMIAKVAERGLTVRECEALVEAEYITGAPSRFEEESGLGLIMRFRDAVAEGVAHLNSRGITAKSETSYFGRKTYLTICIEE